MKHAVYKKLIIKMDNMFPLFKKKLKEREKKEFRKIWKRTTIFIVVTYGE